MPQLCGGGDVCGGGDGGAAAAVCRDGLGPSCPGGDDGRMSMDDC